MRMSVIRWKANCQAGHRTGTDDDRQDGPGLHSEMADIADIDVLLPGLGEFRGDEIDQGRQDEKADTMMNGL